MNPNSPELVPEQQSPVLQKHIAHPRLHAFFNPHPCDDAADVTLGDHRPRREGVDGNAEVGRGGYHRFFPLGAGLYSWINSLTACVKSWVSFKPNSVAGGVARSSFNKSSSMRNATSLVFLTDFFLGISTKLTISHLGNNSPCNPYNRIIHYLGRRNNATIKTAGQFNTGTESEQMKKRYPKRGPGFVYLFVRRCGLHKIGFSIDPVKRTKSYPAATLVKAISVPDMLFGERVAHKLFQHCREGWIGERFRMTAADVRKFKMLTTEQLSQ